MPAKLYSFSSSVWASVPRIALVEKQITDVEIVEVNLFNAENYSPAYLKINKNATVPSLIHHKNNHATIDDSTTIAEFLDSAYPEGPSLLPADEAAAAQVRELVAKSHSVDPNLVSLGAVNEQELAQKKPVVTAIMGGRVAALTRFTEEAPEHSVFYSEKVDAAKQLIGTYENPEHAGSLYSAINAEWAKIFAYFDEIELLLASHDGPYLIGKQYTLADVHFTCLIARLYVNRQDLLFENRPHLLKYWKTVQTRESFKVVYAELH
ncbi:hypothetical protein BC936DRAFT_146457 [Jimgerdemannia flammicorona]|uniref:Glutathione S-transferase n=1 Tax=Jimgerdemannia flammicorona TaxID=994334 RepID=A0A433D7K9_9FUNG|nr:hypothetical protein BC936DRAFT_146457 [Jimgerdemannia flammicorona]